MAELTVSHDNRSSIIYLELTLSQNLDDCLNGVGVELRISTADEAPFLLFLFSLLTSQIVLSSIVTLDWQL